MKGINVGLDEQWSSVFITSNSEWFRFHDISDAANPTMQRINPFIRIAMIKKKKFVLNRLRELSRKSRLFYWAESELFSILRVSQHFLQLDRMKFNFNLLATRKTRLNC
ncbi:hypothetical protein V1478_012142 [Vespula squamosa]|uniref:Maturase K n=1 Tax=Vespula squamosa TaxID=30214 RepID=A0ABD2ACZ2_VESSQ